VSSRRPYIRFPDPFLGWGALAMKTAEMMAASAQVIPQRVGRTNTPAQLFAMSNEKVQATIEASHAMSLHWMRMATQATPASIQQWAAFWNSGLTPYHRKAISNARAGKRR